jgi:hypothetical protein
VSSKLQHLNLFKANIMKILKICFFISQAVVLLLTISCSSSDESNEKGVIEKKQDEIAQDAVDSIKDPLERAKAVGDLANERTQQIEEAEKQE